MDACNCNLEITLTATSNLQKPLYYATLLEILTSMLAIVLVVSTAVIACKILRSNIRMSQPLHPVPEASADRDSQLVLVTTRKSNTADQEESYALLREATKTIQPVQQLSMDEGELVVSVIGHNQPVKL